MKWSVVIPVYLGKDGMFAPVLRQALGAFQQVEARDLELVLCCDGPDPRVESLVRESSCPFPIRVVHQDHRGQSAATNRAAQEGSGEFLLFLAQDILPHPKLMAEHARVHKERPGTVVLGTLPYHPDVPITPFMKFLIHGGPQFAHHLLHEGEVVSPSFLYAPNFSMRRDAFLGCGGFREDLPYACQDTELGIRLVQEGYALVYAASAIGYHWHPQTLEGYTERQYVSGRNTVRLVELHPTHRKVDWLREKVLEYFVAPKERIPEYREWVRTIEPQEGRWKVFVPHSPVGPYEQDALFFLYDRITKFHFYRGVQDALADREGDWLSKSFAPWRLASSEPLPEFRRSVLG